MKLISKHYLYRNNTLTNFILIGTGNLIPLLCAKLNGGYLLVLLNQYYISTIIAATIDSFQIIQIEYIYSSARNSIQRRITSRLINRQLGFAILLAPAILSEYLCFGTGYMAMSFNKHIFNIAKVGMIYGDKENIASTAINYIGIFRNVLMIISCIIMSDGKYFILSLILISIAEIFCIWIIMGELYNTKIQPAFISIKELHKLINKSTTSLRTLGIGLAAFVNSLDRFIISIFEPTVQIFYLTYKVLQQYIDGFFGIFAFELHISQMRTKIIPSSRKILSLIFGMSLFGFGASFFLFKDIGVYSALIFIIVCILLSFRRLFDGVLNANLRAKKQYKIGIYKCFIEIISLIMSFTIAYKLFPLSSDKIFVLYVFATLIPIIYLLKYTRDNERR